MCYFRCMKCSSTLNTQGRSCKIADIELSGYQADLYTDKVRIEKADDHTGAMAQDEKLPSVRELAGTLAINPNTIQRAYRELEAEGYLYSVSGKGTFAAKDIRLDAMGMEELFLQFEEIAEELLYFSVTAEELKSRIERLEKRRKEQ